VQVLVVHNRYRSGVPSGENRVVDQEVDALRARGHDVATYVRSSDEIARMSLPEKLLHGLSPVHSAEAVRAVDGLLAEHRTEVLHLHNPYPLISMSVVDVAHRRGAAVVQTVHNHRHTCMKGTYQRDGRDCRDCLRAGTPLPGVQHACYRESRAQSVVMAAALLRDRRRRAAVDRLVALTPEIRTSLLESGADAARITVKPNSVPDPGPPAPLGEGAVFVGRLSREKGVVSLVEAWRREPGGSRGRLVVVGDGPDRAEVEAAAAGRQDVELAGPMEPADVARAVSGASLVVVPSLWPEAFPLVVLEAMAAGRALLVTDQGGLPRVVDDSVGRVVAPDVDGLADGLASLLGDRPLLERLGAGARARYEAEYHPDVVTSALESIYEQVRQAVRP
jgi:glycosyltransferase involved in cell wall biosynthesis